MIRPTSVEPVKEIASTPGCRTSAAPRGLAETGHDVQHARREPGFRCQLAEAQCGQRSLLGGLEHHRVPTGERRRDLPRGHRQGEVPRNDCAHHPHRLAQRVVEKGPRHRDGVALHLVGQPGVVAQRLRNTGNIDAAGLEVRLAVVPRLEQPQLVGVGLDQVRQLPEQERPLVRVHPAPFAVGEGRARRPDRAVNVRRPRLGHLGDYLFGGRIDRREPAAGFRFGPLVPDPETGADLLLHLCLRHRFVSCPRSRVCASRRRRSAPRARRRWRRAAAATPAPGRAPPRRGSRRRSAPSA